jgi:hypothetical protein
VPLTDLYHKAGDYIRARGGVLHFRQPIEGFTSDTSQVRLNLRESQPRENQSDEGAPSFSRSLREGGDFDFVMQ